MLSRIAINQARSALAVQPVRCTQTSASKSAAAAVPETSERDLVNFPRPVRLIEPSKVRMGFIPEEWFQFFHSKTGVTGPYAFGLGLTTFLCSKEIYVMEHEFYAGVSLGIMAVVAIKKLGPSVAKFLDEKVQKDDEALNASRIHTIANTTKAIAGEKLEQERAKGQMMLFEAKHENVALQLEAAYRQQLQTVYQEVKKRLDYQVECQNVQRNMEQRHMVDWVIRNVKSAITPEQEKAALSQCVATIKSLAKANTARI
jgi:F-type H+-transporting ATPase subunit b